LVSGPSFGGVSNKNLLDTVYTLLIILPENVVLYFPIKVKILPTTFHHKLIFIKYFSYFLSYPRFADYENTWRQILCRQDVFTPPPQRRPWWLIYPKSSLISDTTFTWFILPTIIGGGDNIRHPRSLRPCLIYTKVQIITGAQNFHN
jgi:hypothetical protein